MSTVLTAAHIFQTTFTLQSLEHQIAQWRENSKSDEAMVHESANEPFVLTFREISNSEETQQFHNSNAQLLGYTTKATACDVAQSDWQDEVARNVRAWFDLPEAFEFRWELSEED